MIYITGDTHGERERFSPAAMPGEDTWGADDTLIICGDFGFIFTNDESENAFLDKLSEKPYTICFCDGNHENFPAIYAYPTEEWHGGKVHRIRKNIFHLMRGQVFEIDGKRIFTMGGAYSIDKNMRTDGYSWWREELPASEEYAEAMRNLRKNGNRVDHIITHTAPREVILQMVKHPDMHDAELTEFLERIMNEVEFKMWFFGHWHQDRKFDDRFRAMWFDVIELG